MKHICRGYCSTMTENESSGLRLTLSRCTPSALILIYVYFTVTNCTYFYKTCTYVHICVYFNYFPPNTYCNTALYFVHNNSWTFSSPRLVPTLDLPSAQYNTIFIYRVDMSGIITIILLLLYPKHNRRNVCE